LVETTIRRQVIIAVNRIQNLTYGIRKHSTPLTVRYFFKNDNAADRVTLLGGVINIVLSTAKFAVGVTCHSSALIADAGHSLSDLFSDVITLWVSKAYCVILYS
jgi:Co/Zn/Cd efflux system component